MSEIPIGGMAPVYFAETPDAATVIPALVAAFEREKDAHDSKRTHMFAGRFENIYIPRPRLPEIAALSDFITTAASQILQKRPLRHGFWFNEMHPGHRTTLHSHEEDDELLSAVCYLQCPQHSGRLILHDDHAQIVVAPRPGLVVLFPPDLPHEVEENASRERRLSLAFNFGPPNPET